MRLVVFILTLQAMDTAQEGVRLNARYTGFRHVALAHGLLRGTLMKAYRRDTYLRFVSALIATALAGGCSSNPTGPQGSSGGCGPATHPVNPQLCAPQLSASDICLPFGSCEWTAEIPCASYAGAEDSGTSRETGTASGGPDAGLLFSGEPEPCASACDAVRPGNTPRPYACSATSTTGAAGTITCDCRCMACETGRPPRGFVPRFAGAPNPVAERLAQMAQLEAASVDAFRALHADIAVLGAPRSLLRAVRSAASDEVRHARMTKRAAERFGARVPEVRVPPIARRSLEQLAVENAEEGCARETFGAALAAMQAERARDPGIRRMMSVIARDEREHAALAWRIAAWLEDQLDAPAAARVMEARIAALNTLEREMTGDEPADEVIGLPSTRALRAALAEMRAAMGSLDLAA
jgi:hypothetical protein